MSRKIGSHLTYEERCQISVLLKRGESCRGIGKLIGVSHSTIVKELKRNRSEQGYIGTTAQFSGD